VTLVLSLLNQDWAIQLSDRRLSASQPVTDEYGKATFVITRDVRVAMGLSGLAALRIPKGGHFGRGFDLRRTVAELLHEVAGPDYRWLAVTERLADRLSEVFDAPPIVNSVQSPADRRCQLQFVGFAGTEPPTPIVTWNSNFRDLKPAKRPSRRGGTFGIPPGRYGRANSTCDQLAQMPALVTATSIHS